MRAVCVEKWVQALRVERCVYTGDSVQVWAGVKLCACAGVWACVSVLEDKKQVMDNGRYSCYRKQ